MSKLHEAIGLAKGSGVRASSPEANTFLHKINYSIDILKHPPVTVAKKKIAGNSGTSQLA